MAGGVLHILHARVKDLGGGEGVGFGPAHDLSASLDARDVVLGGDLVMGGGRNRLLQRQVGQRSSTTTKLDDATHVRVAHLQHVEPIFAGVVVDEVGGPHELDVGQVHAAGLPDLNHVAAASTDFLDVSAHFVVHQREVVRHVEDELDAGTRQLVDVHGTQQTLGDVHAA